MIKPIPCVDCKLLPDVVWDDEANNQLLATTEHRCQSGQSFYGGLLIDWNIRQRDLRAGRLVFSKFESGNDIPVERVTIRASELKLGESDNA